jgi:hypothetical protein
MLISRSLLAFAFCCTGALAQEAASFTALSACRVDENRVLLRATFDGSACLAVNPLEPADIGEPRGTIVAFTISTEATAEMCTMQIVSIPFEQVLDIPLPVVDFDITVVDPQNNVLAQGLAFADDTVEYCALPPG